MFLKITICVVAAVCLIWLVRRIRILRSRRKGWMEFQFASEALTLDQLSEIAEEFRKYVKKALNADLAALGFAEQTEFLHTHAEELQMSAADSDFAQIRLEKHPEQTPWLGMAAYLGELVRAQHPGSCWSEDDGGPNVVKIAYPGDPAYPSYSPFADVYMTIYDGRGEAGFGAPFYGFRHILRANAFNNRQRGTRYTAGEAEALQKKIEEHFGKIRFVWHEIFSVGIHVDIFIVDPPDSSVVYLITGGMGAYLMPVPGELRLAGAFERLEVMVTLPADWPLKKTENNLWPTRMLKDIARYPIGNDALLGPGHTVQMPKPYANTAFSAVLLLPPAGKPPEDACFQLSPELEVGVLQLIPLRPEERDYVMAHGDEVEALFDESTRIINPERKSVIPTP